MVYFIDYLKKVGFKLTKGSSGEPFVVLKDNYRFPTLSCKLEQNDDGENENADGNLIFSLSYFISDDFSKQSLEFSFEDWYNWKRKVDEEVGTSVSSSSFETIGRNLGFDFFEYFSITETLLTNVYQSRLKGRKAWKKRNWKLPVRWANVYKAFGLSKIAKNKVYYCNEKNKDLIKVLEDIVELDKIMQNCIAKAAKDYSYAPFDVYFDCYKKKLKLEKIIYDIKKQDGALVDFEHTNCKREVVFKEFAKEVLSLQKDNN